MMTNDPALMRRAEGQEDDPTSNANLERIVWTHYEPGRVLTAEARIAPEPDGGFSAYIPQLPGVASQGTDVEDAFRNIADALAGAIRTYRDSGDPIPWIDRDEIEAPAKDERSRRIVVHV